MRNAGRRAARRQGMKSDSLSTMVDIVFLLLAFFVLASAITPRPVESKLDCSPPSRSHEIDDLDVQLLRVVVDADGVALNGRSYRGPHAIAALSNRLDSLAIFSTRTPVQVACMPDSPHRLLIGVLNALNHAEFAKVAVCSL